MPLSMAAIGEKNAIQRIIGRSDTKKFLENLGFVAGAEVTVISSMGGNLIVNVKGARVAIDHDMARAIMV